MRVIRRAPRTNGYLALLTDPGDRRQTEPAWPWALVLALAALLAERLNRALRRKEGV